jgi:PAS domain S-box-containing protein
MPSLGQKIYPFEKRPVFLLSLLLAFVIIFGAAYIVAHKSYTKAIDATIRSNETRATLLAKLILEHQRAAIGVLQSYADRPFLVDSVKKRDFEGALKHLIDLAKHNPEMDWPFIANPDSTVWVNYPVDRQVMNKGLTYRDWYKGASKKWEPYISTVYKLIVGEKDLAVAVSTPILDEKGKVIGILATAQSTAFFRKIIDEVGLNLDTKITLIDQEGHIICSNGFPYTKEIIGYPSFEFVRKAMKGERGDVEVRDPSDRDRIRYVSFAPIEGIGWSIIVEKARSEVLRSEYSSLVPIGMISLLIYGVIVLFLVRSRERHRHIQGLERLNKELDDRVRERTAELEATNQNLNKKIIERKQVEGALREGEERLRFALEASHTGAWDLDLVDHSAYRSLEHDRIFGYAQLLPQWTYEMFLDHVLPEDRAMVDAKFRAATAARSDWNFECRIRRVDGEVRWIWAAGRHSEGTPGSSPRLAGIVQDITERKRAEEALRESEEKFRVVSENARAVFGIIQGDRFVYANPYLAEISGYGIDEILSMDFSKMIHPAFRDEVMDRARKRLAGESPPTHYEFVMLTKSGESRWLDFSPEKIELNGKPAIIGTAFDITERKRSEQTLRASETRFKLLSETSGRLLVTNNPQGIVNELCRDVMGHIDCQAFFNFLVNKQVSRLHLNAWAGIPPEEARKIEWLDFGVAVCGCAARDGCRIVAEHIPITPDMRTELVKSYGIKAYACHPLLGTGGTVIGTLSFGTRSRETFSEEDLSLMKAVADQVATAMERMKLIEDLQQFTHTLEQRVKDRTAELAKLSSQLVNAQENERRRVSYDLHDNVWQALGIIKTQIEHLLSRKDNTDSTSFCERSKELIPLIQNTVVRIRSMQGDLWPYVLDDIGILATLEWYCREFKLNHPALSIEKHIDLTEEEVPVPLKIVIYRVMQEALSNVAKHNHATHVILCLMKKNSGIEFTVEDNGIGFDPEETMVKTSPWGGLGLLSVKARTELSGGILGVESAKGKGTTVRASWLLSGNN